VAARSCRDIHPENDGKSKLEYRTPSVILDEKRRQPMKRSKFSEEQIAFCGSKAETDTLPVAE
jgi:hypothetical protein